MVAPFRDRRHAGAVLGEALKEYAGRDDVVVLGLPRGGVPVAHEVARRLGAPLDVFVVRKLGVPGHEELAMGAIASGGVMVVDPRTREWARVGDDALGRVIAREQQELGRRERAFRGDRPPLDVAGKTVILVDDGLATGASMRAAVEGMRAHSPGRLVVAVPVAAPSSCREIGALVDDIVCVARPEPLHAVGLWYDDFTATTDREVHDLLELEPPRESPNVLVDAGDVQLAGDLWIPSPATGVVLFAHGSGSSRASPRNRVVAEALHDAGFATLLFDLLTSEEERAERFTRHLRFDIALLARRLIAAVDWVAHRERVRDLPIGTFGASTGAAAALVAAAARPALVRAVVSRGGRPDLAGPALERVQAPTLLIVGGEDDRVIELNQEARVRLGERAELRIVPGASHLFEEPGAIEQVIGLATDWFRRHLSYFDAYEARPNP